MSTTTAQLFSHETTKRLIVDPLWARSTVLPHLRRIQTTATILYLPKVDDGTAAWVPELQPIPDAGVQASELPVKPLKVGATQVVSNESRDDAGAAEIIGSALVDALASTIDAAAVNGAGPNGPTGLPGVVGVNDIDADPATLDGYIDAITAIHTAGGIPTVAFVSPADWGAIQKLPSVSGSNVFALVPGGPSEAAVPQLFGLTVSVVPSLAAGTAWVVDGERTVCVERTPALVDTNEGPMFVNDGLMVRATMRLEFATVYPKSVSKIHLTP